MASCVGWGRTANSNDGDRGRAVMLGLELFFNPALDCACL